jgi:sulfur relay (sulfurtransferase) DsrC/TusE family protein
MTIARPVFTKLILTQQFFAKNFYAAFRDSPINGLMVDTTSSMVGRTDGRSFRLRRSFLVPEPPKKLISGQAFKIVPLTAKSVWL